MNVKFLIPNSVSDSFYAGFPNLGIAGFDSLSDKEKFAKLSNPDLASIGIKRKEAGSFRERVELNQITREPSHKCVFTLLPRRGYKIASFDFSL